MVITPAVVDADTGDPADSVAVPIGIDEVMGTADPSVFRFWLRLVANPLSHTALLSVTPTIAFWRG